MSQAPSRQDPSAETAPVPRVLLVDDHPDIRSMLSLALARAAVGVLTACDGQEALELIERDLHAGQPMVDLIVLDVMMPGLSGSDVLRALRARFTELPPVLIISALDSPAHVEELLGLGAADYLSKPVEIEVFRQNVRALIHAPRRRSIQQDDDVPVAKTTEPQPLREIGKPRALRGALWIG
jgi:two-component system, OmpR family, response regulator PrrA